MSMEHCYFHPKLQAVDKCERCNKLICLQDKRTFTKTYGGSGIGTDYNYYYAPIKYTFCPPCYYQAVESGYRSYRKISSFQKPFLLLFMIPFILVPIIMIVMVMNSPFGLDIFVLFPIIFIFIAIGMFLFIFKTQSTASEMMKSEYENIRVDKEQFYSNSNLTTKNNYNEIYCNQCGSKILKSDFFCPNCGDSTKDELENLKS